MALIDLEGGAQSDRQACQNVVALHEKEGLPVDFLMRGGGGAEEEQEEGQGEGQSGVGDRWSEVMEGFFHFIIYFFDYRCLW